MGERPEEIVHDLKCWPNYYTAIYEGLKTFEVRKDDRGYQIGDVLLLREWDAFRESYTGRQGRWKVRYLLRDHHAITSGYVVMAIEPVP